MFLSSKRVKICTCWFQKVNVGFYLRSRSREVTRWAKAILHISRCIFAKETDVDPSKHYISNQTLEAKNESELIWSRMTRRRGHWVQFFLEGCRIEEWKGMQKTAMLRVAVFPLFAKNQVAWNWAGASTLLPKEYWELHIHIGCSFTTGQIFCMNKSLSIVFSLENCFNCLIQGQGRQD